MEKVWRPTVSKWKVACKKCGSFFLRKYGHRNGTPVLSCKDCWHVFRHRECPHCGSNKVRFVGMEWENHIRYCSACKKSIGKSWHVKKLAGTDAKEKRAEDDFYATYAEDVIPLLQRENFIGCIWEPACWDGAISEVLMGKYGENNVYSSDLVDRGYGKWSINFLKTKAMPEDCVNIITNPPYSLTTDFVHKWMELLPDWGKMALLLKLSFFEWKTRDAVFENYPPKTAYVFKKRLSFRKAWEESKYKWWLLAFAWFVWEKGAENENTVVIRI